MAPAPRPRICRSLCTHPPLLHGMLFLGRISSQRATWVMLEHHGRAVPSRRASLIAIVAVLSVDFLRASYCPASQCDV